MEGREGKWEKGRGKRMKGEGRPKQGTREDKS